MKVSFFTLGCKLNQAETEDLKAELSELGAAVVPFSQKADVSVIRACGVTCGASQTTREMIRQAKKRGTYVIAMGCLENTGLPEIDFKSNSNSEVIRHLSKKFKFHTEKNSHENLEKTRALIKIQNGCNFNCAYCIIPRFRGRATSIPAEKIIKQINKKVQDGFNEVVLTGVNICQYKDGREDLSGLLQKILKKTKVKRIRLGSLDPRLITEDLIKIYSNSKNTKRLLPHWHLSLQSGSDEVLKKMNRFYTTEQYYQVIKKLRKNNPLFSFTTDIIVGFPDETESDFKKTCLFVKKCEFAKTHVFRFSPRPGTPAQKMLQIQDRIKSRRAEKLIKLSTAVAKKFAKKFINKSRPVLFENKNTGYTPEFIKIKSAGKPNTIVEFRLSSSIFA